MGDTNEFDILHDVDAYINVDFYSKIALGYIQISMPKPIKRVYECENICQKYIKRIVLSEDLIDELTIIYNAYIPKFLSGCSLK